MTDEGDHTPSTEIESEQRTELNTAFGAHDPASFMRCVKLSLQGLQYDINHWSQLPPVRENQPTLRCVQYVATRGQRALTPSLVIFVILLVCISLAVRGGRRCGEIRS